MIKNILVIFLFNLFINCIYTQTDSISFEIDSNLTLISAVGDIMLGTDYPEEKYLPPGNNCMLGMENIIPYLEGDIVFGNIEGVFAGEKGIPKECKNPDQCYVFRMPVDYINCIKEAGFNLVSVANNHVNDFGPEGRENTANVLTDANIRFAGFISHPYIDFIIDSIKYGFCAFAPNKGTVNLNNINNAIKIVSKLNAICDIVIVSIHGGAEGKDHQHVTREDEIFYGHNRGNIYEFAHNIIDAGADVVLGHGPHVTRAIEVYKNRLIAYSLGNFSTYARFNISGPNGIAPILKIYCDRKGRFIKGNIIPVYQSDNGITRYDPENRVIYKLQELTNEDFPNSDIVINNDGQIFYKNNQ